MRATLSRRPTPPGRHEDGRSTMASSRYNGALFGRLSLSWTVFVLLALASGIGASGCGRTDLELPGRDAAADAPRDAPRDRTTDGTTGTGGRSATGGAGGGGGRASGGAPATGGRPGTGGAPRTGGRAGTGGAPGSGGRVATMDGGVPDAAADCPPADAGPDLPPATPGTLPCGAESCDVKTQSCCVSLAVGSVGARCVPLGAACPGAALDCDEPADCPGAVCCFGLQVGGAGVAVGSRCGPRAGCNGVARFVVCRANADCGGTTPACCTVGGVPICQAACTGS